MPEYIYRCIFKHEITVTEPMTTDSEHICHECGGKMWRKPQPFVVHWASGLPPSAGEFSPEIQNHLDNVDQIREETDAFYEERDQNKTD